MKRISRNAVLSRAVKFLIAAAVLAMIVAAFHGVHQCALAARIQAVPAAIAFDFAGLSLFVVLAVLWGRLYCKVICPLGIVQDLIRWILRKKVRRVCSRLPETLRQRIIKWAVFTLFMAVGLSGLSFMWLDPYGIFGRGVTLSGGLFFVVLALSFVGKGRFWCNWICPVGTLLQFTSRFSFFKDRFEKCDHCEECRKCLKK